MNDSPQAVRAYVERLIDESRLAPGLVEVASVVRPRFAEASEATDSSGPALSASDYAGIYEIRFEHVKRSGNTHRGFQETISCLRSAVDPDTQLRLLSLHNDNLLFIFLVEIEKGCLVGLMFAEINKTITDEYRKSVDNELSASAHDANPQRIDFEYLKRWESWPDSNLRSIYSEATRAWMLRVQKDLGSEEERAIEVTPKSFPGLVRTLRKRMHDGTKELGEAITRSSELTKAGRPAEGRAILEAFIDRCPSPFYRDIAVAHSRSL